MLKQITRRRIAQMIVLCAIGLSSFYCTQRKAVSTSVSNDEPKSTTASASDKQLNSATIPSEPSKAADESEQMPLLELDKSIEKELKSDQYHSYQIEAEASQYLQAAVMQKGIDIVAIIFDPSGKKVYETDSPNGTQGPEPVYLITESKGRYRLEIRSLEKAAKSGKYEVKLEQLRASIQEDKSIVEAYKALGDASLLESQQDPKSREEAIKRYEEAIRLFEEAKEETQAASSYNSLAELYRAKGDFGKAEPLYQRALAIREKALGSDHPDVAVSLNNLAALYTGKNDFKRAEPLLQRALEIREKALEPEHPEIAISLINLAALYRAKGDYGKAEPLYQRALAIAEKALGPENSNVAVFLRSLALLYEAKGDYNRAEPLYQRALAIREKALGPEHPSVAGSLNNLAALYSEKGDYYKAEEFYQRALAIREKTLGPEHPNVAASLHNLAALYRKRSDYIKAETLFQRALAIAEKALGPEHLNVAASLHNLAALYRERGDYIKAEPLFQRALAIYEKALGPEHPDVAQSFNDLAVLYDGKGEIKRAVSYKIRANECNERDLSRNLIPGSENEKLIYLNRVSFDIDYTLSLHLKSSLDDLAIQQAAMTILLQRKGRALDAMTQSIESLRRRAAPADRLLLDRLAQTRAQLSALTLRGSNKEGLEKHKADLKALGDEVEALEKQISARSAEFKALTIPITLEAVRRAVPSNAALLEFAVYRPYDPKTSRYEFAAVRYAVYALKNNGELRWADLGEASIIDNAVSKFRLAMAKQPGKPLSDIKREVKPKARALDKLVMEKTRRLLGDAKRLLLAPDGNLNLIPFDALVDETGKYLVESYEISYLTSGRDLLRLHNGITSNQRPVVMANPDYGKGPGTKAGNLILSVDQLPGTAQEAAQIKRVLELQSEELLTEERASKRELNQLSRPSILHIAAHGYFLQDEQRDADAEQRLTRIKSGIAGEAAETELRGLKLENPLLKSGLLLAGANRGNGDEGIMTALEVTGLDLWGTKMAVLSACDTGVGEVKNGDGVYGLRRALVLAGSESQLMSLWPVSDAGTRDLMINYYKALKAGEGRSAGMRRVRLEFLKDAGRAHPYYWAGFIQSGEWANLDGER